MSRSPLRLRHTTRPNPDGRGCAHCIPPHEDRLQLIQRVLDVALQAAALVVAVPVIGVLAALCVKLWAELINQFG